MHGDQQEWAFKFSSRADYASPFPIYVLELPRVHFHFYGIPVGKWEYRVRIPDAELCIG